MKKKFKYGKMAFSKIMLLLLTFIMMFTFISCEKSENNPERSYNSSKVTSSDLQSEDENSVSEETSEESTQVVSEASTSDVSIETGLSITDIEDFEDLGLTKDDYRYLAIKAFLDGDTTTLEELGGFEEGIFDSYKTLKIGEYSIYLGEYEVVFFKFNVTESGLDTMPVGQYTYLVDTGMGTWFSPKNRTSIELTTPHKAIYYWIIMSGEYTFHDLESLDETEKLYYERVIIDYILVLHDGITLEQFQEYARILFGINDLTPSEFYKSETGLYSLPPRGGSTWSNKVLSETEENNITTITIQFYADWAETIKSHVIEYKLMNVDGNLVFISSDYIYESQLEPAHYSV